ncbi:CoA transferase [Comamonas denitrificans]|uniref:CoA transferase n=1 Tax=Comamonas denitrificans TaxID=117506 RepID=A0A939KEH0_9BURK|nr:CaiB/BaiF CoA-transferase family protein [Comamonas denitrificans]MBO1250696.1 CoA transferase [Comamonas denitrificans]
MEKVLHTLRVLEIGGLGPGPFCAMHLADLGADVISLVRPGNGGLPITGDLLNRGKRSVFADLKSPEGRALVLQLVRDADVLIEGMRPGSMERLGLGPQECHAVNPALVYGRMTGWGQHGPLAHTAGHDANYTALSGAMWGCSPADARPVAPVGVLGDIGGGALYLMTGLLAGVLQARASGQGTVVDAAIVDGAAHMLNLMLSMRSTGLVGDTRSTSLHTMAPFYDTYVCADGEHIVIGPIEPQFYQLLLQRLGLEGDPDFTGDQWDRRAWPQRRARLAALFLQHPQAHWQALLEGTDACFSAVLSPKAALHHPHLQARGVYAEPQDTLQASPAPRFGAAPYPINPTHPAGAHTEAVLQDLAQGGRGWRA